MNRSIPALSLHHRLRSPPKPMSIESMMASNHLILCHPLLLLPSIFPRIRVFSNESALRIRWPNYWSFSFSISPTNEHPGLKDGLVGSPCSPGDSQESSPAPLNGEVLIPIQKESWELLLSEEQVFSDLLKWTRCLNNNQKFISPGELGWNSQTVELCWINTDIHAKTAQFSV